MWWGRAELTFGYVRDYHASGGRVAECLGMIAQAASCAAHAVLAARGQWVTNDEVLLTRAGLREIDEFISVATPVDDAGRRAAIVDKQVTDAQVAMADDETGPIDIFRLIGFAVGLARALAQPRRIGSTWRPAHSCRPATTGSWSALRNAPTDSAAWTRLASGSSDSGSSRPGSRRPPKNGQP